MTLRQFYKALAALDLTWTVNSFDRLRSMGEAELLCPITAVANSKGASFGMGAYRRAGIELGLDTDDITEIVNCADSMLWASPVRADLLTAVNRKDLI